MRDLNHFYQRQPALWQNDFDPRGFGWIEANDADQSVYTFLRYAGDPADFLVIALNFTPVPRHDYRIGVPEPGFYRELLNSDAALYGGGNVGNLGGRHSDPVGWHRFAHSLSLTIPPLGNGSSPIWLIGSPASIHGLVTSSRTQLLLAGSHLPACDLR